MCRSIYTHLFIVFFCVACIAFYLRLALRIIPCWHPLYNKHFIIYNYMCLCVCLHQMLLLLLLFAVLGISQPRHSHTSTHILAGNCLVLTAVLCSTPLLCACSPAIEVFNIVLYFIMRKFHILLVSQLSTAHHSSFMQLLRTAL